VTATVSYNDVHRIEALGHKRFTKTRMVQFIEAETGVRAVRQTMVLKHKQGACVFYNRESRTCDIYEHRPLVCQLFPFTELRHHDNIMYINQQNICPPEAFKGQLIDFKELKVLIQRIIDDDYMIHGKIIKTLDT
jgi:Fe-S-cluster containining protein